MKELSPILPEYGYNVYDYYTSINNRAPPRGIGVYVFALSWIIEFTDMGLGEKLNCTMSYPFFFSFHSSIKRFKAPIIMTSVNGNSKNFEN